MEPGGSFPCSQQLGAAPPLWRSDPVWTVIWSLFGFASVSQLHECVTKLVNYSAVGTATGCGLSCRGVGPRVPVVTETVYRPCRLVWLQDPTSPCRLGTRTLYRVLKRPRREAQHTPPTGAEVRKTWMSAATPRHAFMVQRLVKEDNWGSGGPAHEHSPRVVPSASWRQPHSTA
jgi:hypothetical protein